MAEEGLTSFSCMLALCFTFRFPYPFPPIETSIFYGELSTSYTSTFAQDAEMRE